MLHLFVPLRVYLLVSVCLLAHLSVSVCVFISNWLLLFASVLENVCLDVVSVVVPPTRLLRLAIKMRPRASLRHSFHRRGHAAQRHEAARPLRGRGRSAGAHEPAQTSALGELRQEVDGA